MPVYVDAAIDFSTTASPRCFQGVKSCHMYADTLNELHTMAAKIGLKRSWFQTQSIVMHYDLVPSKRAHAIKLGAIEQDRHQCVAKWREIGARQREEVRQGMKEERAELK